MAGGIIKSCQTCSHRHFKQFDVVGGHYAKWVCRLNKTFGKVCKEWIDA